MKVKLMESLRLFREKKESSSVFDALRLDREIGDLKNEKQLRYEMNKYYSRVLKTLKFKYDFLEKQQDFIQGFKKMLNNMSDEIILNGYEPRQKEIILDLYNSFCAGLESSPEYEKYKSSKNSMFQNFFRKKISEALLLGDWSVDIDNGMYNEDFSQYYNEIAFDYYNYPLIARNIDKIIQQYVSTNMKQDDELKLLELSSGTANLTEEIRNLSYKVDESDNSLQMFLNRKKDSKSDFTLNSIEFMADDLIGKKYDVLYSNGGAMWFINTKDGYKMQSYIDSYTFFQALKNMANMTKKNGLLLINIQEEDSNHEPINTKDGKYIYQGIVEALNEKSPEVGIKKRYTLRSKETGNLAFDQSFNLKRYGMDAVVNYLKDAGFSTPIIDKEKGFMIFKKDQISLADIDSEKAEQK